MVKDLFSNEVDRLYGDDYRSENSSALNPNHALPGNTTVETSGESLTPNAAADGETAKELARQIAPKERVLSLDVFGHSVVDFVNTMLPNGGAW